MSSEKFLAKPLTEIERRFLEVVPKPPTAREITDFEKLQPTLRKRILTLCVAFFSLPAERQPALLEYMERDVAGRRPR